MSETRAAINRVKKEKFRVSGVPIDPTETIFQGDALEWSPSTHVATKAGPSATAFIGISETTNPISTLGSPDFLSNLTNSQVNVIQAALVERIAEHAETLYPFDKMTVGSDAQKASKLWSTNTTECYIVDPKWATASGKAVVAGDLVKVWVKPRPIYSVATAAAAPLT